MITKLPEHNPLSVQKLAGVFDSTTTSYKFYWFLALMSFVKNGKVKISIDEIAIEMIAKVWYPSVSYKLSFGKQDQFSTYIFNIQSSFSLRDDIDPVELKNFLRANKQNPLLIKTFKNISRYVSTRFISPWFRKELTGLKDSEKDQKILEYALLHKDTVGEKAPPYSISPNRQIEINNHWFQYLTTNMAILDGFISWKLLNYLYLRNPNVPNIASKLEPPKKRNMTLASKFWDNFLANNEDILCIYSGDRIEPLNYSIDHFIPWSYAGHDHLWNLLPTFPAINSSKNNLLPSVIYKEKFKTLQYGAFKSWINNSPGSEKMLEDYVLLFKSNLREINEFSKNHFTEKLWENIEPQMQIASNMGFSPNWEFRI